MNLAIMTSNPVARRLLALGCVIALAASGSAVQLSTRSALNSHLLSNGRCDKFDKVTFTGNQLQLTPGGKLDEFTSAGSPAQTGLVSPMVEYRPGPPLAGSVVFLNAGYGGGTTKRIWANNSQGMTINYRVPVRAFGMDFHAFPGFSGNLNARIKLADNTIVMVPFSFTNAQTPYFFGFEDSRCIVEVQFQDLTGQAAVNIDNHCFGCPPGRGWCEPFPDWAYPFNTSPHQNATRGWYLAEGFANEAGLIQDNYCSPSRGLFLHTTTDLMRNFRCISNGKYVFSGWWWVPSNSDPTQRSYFMLLNQPHTQPGSFSMQVGASATNVVFTPAFGGAQTVYSYAGPLTTKTNQWVNVCAFIDLTNDRIKVYYDGQFLVDAQWRSSDLDSLLQIYAINVYGGDLGGTSWVDDLAIVRDCPKTYQIGRNDFFAWGPDATPVSPQLSALLGATPLKFDQNPIDRLFGASFMGLPSGPCKNFKGRFVSRMRANNVNGTNANGDQLWLGLDNGGTWAYNTPMSGFAVPPPWTTTGAETVSINLNNDVLETINQVGRLDFITRWFTSVDYARLQLWNCNPCWKGYWWDSTYPVELDFTTAGNLKPNFQVGPGAVICDLGKSIGGELTLAVSPAFDDLDIGLSLTAIGEVNGQASQQVARLNISGGETAASLSADFSTISPASVRLRLYNAAGALLLDQARPQSSLALITEPSSLRLFGLGNTRQVDRPLGSSPNDMCLMLKTNATSLLVGSTTVNGVVKIVVSGLNPAATVGNISHLQFYGQGNPAVEISNVRGFVQGEIGVSTLGGAVLSSVDDGIILNNLLDPDEDGVRLDLPNSNGFRIGIFATWLPIGDVCKPRITAYANRNGTPDVPVGTITLDDGPGLVQVTADYSSVSSPTTRVIVYRQGMVVANRTGLPTNSVQLAELPIVCEKGGPTTPPSPPCFLLEMASIQPITVAGTTYQGDRVAILAEPTVPTTVSQYSRVEITGGVAEEMLIADPMALRSITGTVTLQNFIPDEAGQQVKLEFRYPGQQQILDTKWVTLGPGGTYSSVTGLYGQVEVLIQGSHWLRKKITVNVGASGAVGANASLINGDCDGSNLVESDDFDMLVAAFGYSIGDPGYSVGADLDGSGTVESDDFDILIASFGLAGD